VVSQVGYNTKVGAVKNYNLYIRGCTLKITRDDDGKFIIPQTFRGCGTALKPAAENWILVRKPLAGTVAVNILKHGVGGINIDESRVSYQGETDQASATPQGKPTAKSGALAGGTQNENERKEFIADNTKGRWPSNVIFSHSSACQQIGTKKVPNPGGSSSGSTAFGQRSGWNAHENRTTEVKRNRDDDGLETVEAWECVENCPVRLLNEQSGQLTSGVLDQATVTAENVIYGKHHGYNDPKQYEGNSGGASRFYKNFSQEPPFYYTAKASKSDKNDGLNEAGLINKHPTVKSQNLMRYLVKLITPKGGTVLDPFAGSGSTLLAAISEGMRFIGIERDTDYIAIAKQRLETAGQTKLDEVHQHELFDMVMSGELD
jgi:site-specific DNA-methyltransferase (adenine-specific)